MSGRALSASSGAPMAKASGVTAGNVSSRSARFDVLHSISLTEHASVGLLLVPFKDLSASLRQSLWGNPLFQELTKFLGRHRESVVLQKPAIPAIHETIRQTVRGENDIPPIDKHEMERKPW